MIHAESLPLLLGVALVPRGGGRRLAWLAAVAIGLAVAGASAGPIATESAPAGFIAVEAGLFVMGALLALWGTLRSWRESRGGAGRAGAVLLALGSMGVGPMAMPYLREAPPDELLLALAVLGGAGAALVEMGRRLPDASPRAEPRSGSRLPGLALIGLGALLAGTGSDAGIVFLGAMAAAVGASLTFPAGARPVPLVPLLTLLILPAWWLMSTIAGPEGLAVRSLPELPWSPAAERLLAPLLLVSAWALTGLWPLHRQAPAALTGPVAALLLARVAVPALPNGVEHWRPLAMPVVVIGLWHAALSGRRAAASAAGAWVGLLAVEASGGTGAALLLLGGLVGELADRMLGRSRWRVAASAAQAVLLGVGAVEVTIAGLHAEVVYTVMAALALVAAAGRRAAAQASTASEPSATVPNGRSP